MTPVTVDIDLQRGATAHLWFQATANVAAPASIDLTGSTFELQIIDVVGAALLTRTIGTPADGVIRFDLSPSDTAALPPGIASRYLITRIIDGAREAWIEGSIDAKGIVNG